LQNKQFKYYNLTNEQIKEIASKKNLDYMPTQSTEKEPDGILNFDFYKCTIDSNKGTREIKIKAKGAKRDFIFRAKTTEEAIRWTKVLK
jgi:hypothetical protein